MVADLPDINTLKEIELGEIATVLTWYQGNPTEDAFLCDQEDFELNEEQDVDYLTAKKSINIPATTLCLIILSKLVDGFKACLMLFVDQNGTKTKTLKKLIYLQSMIKNFDEILYYSIKMPDDSLFYLPSNCNKWERLSEYYELVELATEKEVDESYANFAYMIICGNSAISKGAEESNKLIGFIKTSIYGGYYLLDKKSSKDQFNYFFANPKYEIAMSLLNLLEKEFVTHIYNMGMPDLKVHQVIYIPKTESKFGKLLKKQTPSTEELKEGQFEKISDSDYNDMPPQDSSYHTRDDIFDPETHVKVRVLFDRYIKGLSNTSDKATSKFELGDLSVSKIYNKIMGNDTSHSSIKDEEAIMHVHGGGFIAMSSKSHQIYSRVLTKKTQIPIFSVDYRLSPDSKYPDALED